MHTRHTETQSVWCTQSEQSCGDANKFRWCAHTHCQHPACVFWKPAFQEPSLWFLSLLVTHESFSCEPMAVKYFIIVLSLARRRQREENKRWCKCSAEHRGEVTTQTLFGILQANTLSCTSLPLSAPPVTLHFHVFGLVPSADGAAVALWHPGKMNHWISPGPPPLPITRPFARLT